VLARLLAEIRTGHEHMKEMMYANQAKADASLKEIKEDMKANQAKPDAHGEADREHMQQMMTKIETDQEEMMARMDANQERMNASLRRKIQSGQAEMRSIVNAWIVDMKDDRREIMSYQVTSEACLDSKEINPGDMESEVEHREIRTEEASVTSSGTMKKRRRGLHLAAERHGEPKELTRRNCGSRRKLCAACRKVSRLARVAWRKRNIVRNKCTMAKAERGIRRVGTFRERVWKRHEDRKGMKDLGGGRPRYLKKRDLKKL
jgi:hypothetical protein